MRRVSRSSVALSGCAALFSLMGTGVSPSAAQVAGAGQGSFAADATAVSGKQEILVRPEKWFVLKAIRGGFDPSVADGCGELIALTDASFDGGEYLAQAGFAENEIAAATYTIPAADFPLRIDSVEIVFATSGATVTTTTEWSVLIWEGNPNAGAPIFTASSDDVILPHLQMPPGTNGSIIFFAIDPGDPEQILVNNNGTGRFSVGFRIDDHHNQTQNPCFFGPPPTSNAFPCTDTGPLNFPDRNWLFGVNCGPLGCPPNGGWSTFQSLNVLCKPSGDWMIRVGYTPLNCTPGFGACCLPDGSCELLLIEDCAQQGGDYQGDGVPCSQVNCPPPTGACCFGTACLNLTQQDCGSAGGAWLGGGTQCAAGNSCPTGACCLPNGQCLSGVTALQCNQQGGTFKGPGSNCATANCPQPAGACCLSNGGCLSLTSADCAIIPGSNWAGAGSNCATGCNATCDGDVNGDRVVTDSDLGLLLTAFNQCAASPDYNPDADFNSSGCVDDSDLGTLLNAFGNSCP